MHEQINISRRDIKFKDDDILFDVICQTRKFYAQTHYVTGKCQYYKYSTNCSVWSYFVRFSYYYTCMQL